MGGGAASVLSSLVSMGTVGVGAALWLLAEAVVGWGRCCRGVRLAEGRAMAGM